MTQSIKQYDVIRIVSRPEKCSCEDDCDCGGFPSTHMTVNGKGGYGYGTWVLEDDGREMISFRCIFGEFMATDCQDLVRQIASRFTGFEHVAVEEDIWI